MYDLEMCFQMCFQSDIYFDIDRKANFTEVDMPLNKKILRYQKI